MATIQPPPFQAAMSASAASPPSADGIIADVVAELYAPNIHLIKWYANIHTFRLNKDSVDATPDEVNTVRNSISRLDISTVSDITLEAGYGKSPFSWAFWNATVGCLYAFGKHKHQLLQKNLRRQCCQQFCDIASIKHEFPGEGLRAAVKNGDAAAARKLLSQGVNANYRDQGSSLLHLAAVFYQTEIVFSRTDHGARLDCKNAQGGTPLDCALATQKIKLKRK